MISDLQYVFEKAWEIFGVEFTIYGYTMSFRQVFLWTSFAGLALWFVGRYLDG